MKILDLFQEVTKHLHLFLSFKHKENKKLSAPIQNTEAHTVNELIIIINLVSQYL